MRSKLKVTLNNKLRAHDQYEQFLHSLKDVHWAGFVTWHAVHKLSSALEEKNASRVKLMTAYLVCLICMHVCTHYVYYSSTGMIN